MALKGTLKDFGIADILQLIGQQQKTGTLVLRNKTTEVQVAFRDGNIVKAEINQRRKKDLIGAMLVRGQLIDEKQLAFALEEQKRTLKRLGDVMVAQRLITREKFAAMVHLQTTETLYGLFAWKAGTYEFQAGEVDYDAEMTRPLRAESVLMEGFRMVDEWPVVKKTITSYELTFERLKELPPPPPPEDKFDEALDDAFGEETKSENKGEFKSIGENERKVFRAVTAGRDVRQIIDLACIGEFESCKSLLNLVNLGYLKIIPPVGKTSAIGGGTPVFDQVAGAVGRVVASMLVIALLVGVASRLNVQALNLTGSATTFADPAAQRYISRAQLSRIEAALGTYALEQGRLPERLDELVAARLLSADDLRHPWRDPYFYRPTEAGFVLLPPLR